MARVRVRMFATVREAADAAEAELEASSLRDLIEALGTAFGPEMKRVLSRKIDDEDSLVVLVNGRNVLPGRYSDLRLQDGDEVAIFPPVSGG